MTTADDEVRRAVTHLAEKLARLQSEGPGTILDVVRGPNGRPRTLPFWERELRILRYALERAVETL